MSSSRFPQPRPENEGLITTVVGYFTPEVVRSASSMIGENESSTRQALNAAAPTVLSGITNMVSSSDGQSNLSSMIREGGYGGLTENPVSLFRGGTATNYLVSAGQRHLGKIFGGSVSSVVEEVSRSSGVNGTSSTKLLALVTPLTLGMLGKRASAQGVGSSGLAEMLLGQKAEITAAAPAGIRRILGFGPREVTSSSRAVEPGQAPHSATHIEHYTEPTPTERAAEFRPVLQRRPPGGGLRWLPYLLLVIAAIALLGFLLSRARAPRLPNTASQAVSMAQNGLARLTLPGGVNLSVPPGSINYNLAHFLGDQSATSLPRTFVFDHLNFDSASTRLTPDSQKTVSDLAQVLRAYPNARVQLVGHTDNNGTRASNQALSESRANTVRSMLVSDGVSADRITTMGRGQDSPVASNDTEEGRARNRRIELNVLQK